MDRFRMWFANVMQGRYGTDELNKVLLVLAFALMVLSWFIHMRLIRLLMIAALIIFYCRMMSRNYSARSAENQKWLSFAGRFRGGRSKGGYGGSAGGGYGSQSGGYNSSQSNNSGGGQTYNAGGAFSSSKDPDHKVLRCPGCGEKLRVPKGKGKIKIKCPHCNTEFVKKV